jgi:hypothetical protein
MKRANRRARAAVLVLLVLVEVMVAGALADDQREVIDDTKRI